MSSIFLAREFGVEVWATDLWVEASANWERIVAAGLQDRVYPIHAEAHSLPYAHGFFDALVSMDSYHYFGTDTLYVRTCAQLVRPGGTIGIVVPGLRGELDEGIPEEWAPYWTWDFCSFHSPDWWRRHWTNSSLVEVERADWVPEGWRMWLDWEETLIDHGRTKNQSEAQLLRLDGGERFGFSRVVARPKEQP